MFTYAIVMISLGAGLLVTFLGIPVLAARSGRLPCARAVWSGPRARALLGLDVADPEPVRRRGKPGLMAWVGRRAEERGVLAAPALRAAALPVGGLLLHRLGDVLDRSAGDC